MCNKYATIKIPLLGYEITTEL